MKLWVQAEDGPEGDRMAQCPVSRHKEAKMSSERKKGAYSA